MVAGTLTYNTKLDSSGVENGVKSAGNTIKSIIAGLGITKLITTAVNTITGSLDKAISRYDTLNNFPKVMSNLGISTEESQKAVQKLSDGLQGIPTTLDDASLAVQRFTSANEDVNKSTEYFLAFNNALLAGGSATETQSSALEQLSQAYAKGKPDAIEWRSILTAMPAQLKQVATYLGYTSTAVSGDFYNAIQDGTLSMDDFMQAFVDLNKNGLGEYASFAEQAKSATDGIGTAVTNAKTAIVKGVASIITSVNTGLAEADLPSISEIITTIGKTAQEILTSIGEKLPSIIQILQTVAPAITTIVSAMTAYKLTLLAIKAVDFVSHIGSMVTTFISLIPYITSAKDAMLLLNMAFNVNPIALVVAAIVALIAIFVLLWNKCEWFRNFWINLWDKIKQKVSDIFNGIKGVVNDFINFFSNFPYNMGVLIGKAIVWFATLPTRIKEKFTETKNKTTEWIANMKSTIAQKVPEIIDSIINFFKNLPENMKNIGKNIVEGLWNGILNAKNWLLNKVKDFAKGIITGIKDALGIHSPSKVMRDQVGQWIPKGIAIGIDANTDSALDSLDKMSDEITEKMQDAVSLENGKYSFSGINGSVSQILSSNATFDGNFVVKAEVEEGTLFEAQQRITRRKNLQTGFGG
jgi:tape measure domain-containing protein